MIVIDTNILAYGILAQSDPTKRAQVEKLLAREQVLVPVLWRHEFLNLLASYAKAGMVTLPVAEGTWRQAVATMQDAEGEVDFVRALEIAAQLNISGYDAEFLALAEGANTVLVTEDQKLRKAAPALALSLKEYLAG